MEDTNQDDLLQQGDEPSAIVSVPGYTALAVTLSDVGNNRIGIQFQVSETVNPLHNRTYSLDRQLAKDFHEKLGDILYS